MALKKQILLVAVMVAVAAIVIILALVFTSAGRDDEPNESNGVDQQPQPGVDPPEPPDPPDPPEPTEFTIRVIQDGGDIVASANAAADNWQYFHQPSSDANQRRCDAAGFEAGEVVRDNARMVVVGRYEPAIYCFRARSAQGQWAYASTRQVPSLYYSIFYGFGAPNNEITLNVPDVSSPAGDYQYVLVDDNQNGCTEGHFAGRQDIQSGNKLTIPKSEADSRRYCFRVQAAGSEYSYASYPGGQFYELNRPSSVWFLQNDQTLHFMFPGLDQEVVVFHRQAFVDTEAACRPATFDGDNRDYEDRPVGQVSVAPVASNLGKYVCIQARRHPRGAVRYAAHAVLQPQSSYNSSVRQLGPVNPADFDQDVRDLAAKLRLADLGERVFYNSDPTIYHLADRAEYEQFLVDRGRSGQVGGWYDWRKLHIIDAPHTLGTGKTVSIAAHELLHAVYHSLSIEEKTELRQSLSDFLYGNWQTDRNVLNQSGLVFSLLGYGSDEGNVLFELHAFLGEQFLDRSAERRGTIRSIMSEDLKRHYDLYFEGIPDYS